METTVLIVPSWKISAKHGLTKGLQRSRAVIDRSYHSFGLFVSAFLAATLLPGSSEVMLVGLVLLNPAFTATLFIVATVGNTAGAVLNWYLGRSFMRFAGRRWFPVSTERIGRASSFFNRYGSWPLLLSWLPIVGDPLTVAAGALQIRFLLFLPLVAIGKAARYAIVLAGLELYSHNLASTSPNIFRCNEMMATMWVKTT